MCVKSCDDSIAASTVWELTVSNPVLCCYCLFACVLYVCVCACVWCVCVCVCVCACACMRVCMRVVGLSGCCV